MKNLPITNEQHLHLSKLFAAFAPKHVDRWVYLLGRGSARWRKITPMSIWPGSAFDSYPKNNWDELIHEDTQKYLNERVVVFACGHSNPFVDTLKLKDLNLTHQNQLLEGFVSIVPGELAIAHSHEGGKLLLKKSHTR